MKAKIILFSCKFGEINKFLNKFYSSTSHTDDYTSWQKDFPNPVEITEFIAAFADNSFDLTMWICLDKDVFIKISPSNSNYIIKYLFERYPY